MLIDNVLFTAHVDNDMRIILTPVGQPEQLNMFADDAVSESIVPVEVEEPAVEAKRTRRPTIDRKPPVRVTTALLTTARFLLAQGKEKEEVAQLIDASISTVTRIRDGHYDYMDVKA